MGAYTYHVIRTTTNPIKHVCSSARAVSVCFLSPGKQNGWDHFGLRNQANLQYVVSLLILFIQLWYVKDTNEVNIYNYEVNIYNSRVCKNNTALLSNPCNI